MRELMDYLRANGFKTYIVTFVRAYAQQVYGVPPKQVVGSSIATKYEIKAGSRSCCGCPSCSSMTTMRARRSGSTCS
jgi:hypothetical protein